MTHATSNDDHIPLGQAWLRRTFRLKLPPAAVESYSVAGIRRTELHGWRTLEFYPRSAYPVEPTLAAQMRFALRYEPLDPATIAAAMRALDPTELTGWVRQAPISAYARRAWFLYETFTGRLLDLPDASTGKYVPALDPDRHVTAPRRNSPRHRVIDNLLGDQGFWLVVRRTPRLLGQMAQDLLVEARTLVGQQDPVTLARAINYLYTKETRSSFAIEGETPSPNRLTRFIAALKAAPTFDPTDKAALVRLQGEIVEPRYAAQDWRDFQNFVGETVSGFREEVHFICPQPKDVPRLMADWMRLVRRTIDDSDPVVAAAILAFAFVFVHPFEDGNGRLHRFLIHHVLSRRGFSPRDMIFPVSAAILRDRPGYDAVLATFSDPLMECVEWQWTAEREVTVQNETIDFYRYFDATRFAEYLYDRVADTIRHDLKDELDFIVMFDRAMTAVRDVVDMPDRRASLFVRLCLQNDGRLSKAKRDQFAELSDAEIAAMEAALAELQA